MLSILEANVIMVSFMPSVEFLMAMLSVVMPRVAKLLKASFKMKIINELF